MRNAVVTTQPAELKQVIHHTQVVRFAVGLWHERGVAAVGAPHAVSELVHRGGCLNELRPDEAVPPGTKGDDAISAWEIAHAGGSRRYVKIRVGSPAGRLRLGRARQAQFLWLAP